METAEPATITPIHLESDELRVELDDGLAIIWIDQPDASVNKIAPSTLEAFEEAIQRIGQRDDIEGAIFISGKENSFVAGADLKALQHFEGPEDATELSETAHRLLKRVARLEIPTVAAIHGAAMGGGLELALGCTYRIATDHSDTKMALPEVKLGLIPGGGGTQLLPRLVGLQQSLPLMLTGKNIYPGKARKIGLVDALIHKPGLLQAAKRAARGLADGTIETDRDHSLTDRLLESTSISRNFVFKKARENVEKETRGNYPAPYEIIECVRVGLEEGIEDGLSYEAERFGQMAFTHESKQLVRVFFGKQGAEKNPLSDQASDISRVAVLGAGLMGAGIAEITAKDGLDVLLKDLDLKRAADGRKHVYDSMKRDVKKGIRSAFERDTIIERVRPVADYDDFGQVDLVIEAVPEDLDIKRDTLKEVEEATPEHTIFASNTSSIPIAEIAESSARPGNVLGMHYFSPVAKIPLLEIIKTEQTSKTALATAFETGLKQGKTVIVVNDGPGFYTTRILAMYMNEALLLLDEGADIKEVDDAMMDFGFPMGPFELFDLVGIDVGGKITEVMSKHFEDGTFGDRDLQVSSSTNLLVNANYLGQKSEVGFYKYKEDDYGNLKKQEVNNSIYAFFGGPQRESRSKEEIQERLSLMMVGEAVYCLQDGILQSPQDGDVGAVFGLGFPPFRGGPFRYIDSQTAGAILARLQRLHEQNGSRYKPAPMLHEMAQEQAKFHEDNG